MKSILKLSILSVLYTSLVFAEVDTKEVSSLKGSIVKELDDGVPVLLIPEDDLIIKKIESGNMTDKELSCEDCTDDRVQSLKNEIINIEKSISGIKELKADFNKALPRVLNKELIDLASSILEKDELNEDDRSSLLEKFKIHKKLVLDPLIERAYYLKAKEKLTREEEKEVLELTEILRVLLKNDPMGMLWKKAIVEFDDKVVAREIKELMLFSEYYGKYLRAKEKKNGIIHVRLKGMTWTNVNHTRKNVEDYILGNPSARFADRREGAYGRYEKLAVELKRLKKIEDKKRDEEEDKKERIAGGEILSAGLIKQAKTHHLKYQRYYQEMVKYCFYSYNNELACKRAKNSYDRIGRGYHLRKMFDLIEEAKKDRIEEINAARMQHLGDLELYGDTDERKKRDYSLFSNSIEHGAYADSFGRGRENPSHTDSLLRGAGNFGPRRGPPGVTGGGMGAPDIGFPSSLPRPKYY